MGSRLPLGLSSIPARPRCLSRHRCIRKEVDSNRGRGRTYVPPFRSLPSLITTLILFCSPLSKVEVVSSTFMLSLTLLFFSFRWKQTQPLLRMALKRPRFFSILTSTPALRAWEVRIEATPRSTRSFRSSHAPLSISPLPLLLDWEDESPYPEVRAAVSNTDDMEMAVDTIRAWTIGLFGAIVIPGLNQFLFFRPPSITIGSVRCTAFHLESKHSSGLF
jgi:hypothetical protein